MYTVQCAVMAEQAAFRLSMTKKLLALLINYQQVCRDHHHKINHDEVLAIVVYEIGCHCPQTRVEPIGWKEFPSPYRASGLRLSPKIQF